MSKTPNDEPVIDYDRVGDIFNEILDAGDWRGKRRSIVFFFTGFVVGALTLGAIIWMN